MKDKWMVGLENTYTVGCFRGEPAVTALSSGEGNSTPRT